MRNIFQRYIGIDCSGALTPLSGLKGLRVYCGSSEVCPREVFPSQGKGSKYWSRRGIAEWMRLTDRNGELPEYFSPAIKFTNPVLGKTEAWILGVK